MPPDTNLTLAQRFTGTLIGTAVGDALGLPAEGMSRKRIQRRWKGVWKHRFLFGYGMCSDDAEHTFFVTQALLTHGDDVAAFQKCLAWKLRFWLLGLPAGVGFATLRAIIKLWIGFRPARSGVFSAGNGPAMRAAIIGAYFADQPRERMAFISASTRITHTDPKAETAALAVAEAAAWAVNQDQSAEEWLAGLRTIGNDEEWLTICQRLIDSYSTDKSVQALADALGLDKGVSGYAYHSVPVALYAFIRHPNDFRSALVSALDCGGDTDTVGAMVGALCGARHGTSEIPADWREGILEWPRTLSLLREAGERLATQKAGRDRVGPVTYFWPFVIVRNAVFAIAVLIHGLLRLVTWSRLFCAMAK
jgi:ADP-ribosyl-[dinitrogen reductase] hydrolase